MLEIYILPRLNHAVNLNRPIMSKEIDSVIKNLPRNKSTGPDGFMGEFYQTFRELMPILLKILQKIKEERTFPSSFYETRYKNQIRTLQEKKTAGQQLYWI